MKTSILPASKHEKPLSISLGLRTVWLYLIRALTYSYELQVWRKTDRHGNSYWQAFDPKTSRSTSLNSEAEMRIWIEQRYYAD